MSSSQLKTDYNFILGALNVFVSEGEFHYVKYLCENFISVIRVAFEVNTELILIQSPLIFAINNNQHEIIQYLLGEVIPQNNIQIDITEAILCAAHNGNLSVIKFFLDGEMCPDINYRVDTAFEIASVHNHIDIVKYLYPKITHIDFMHIIIMRKRQDELTAISFILEKGISYDLIKRALILSIENNDLLLVKLLVKYGANIISIEEIKDITLNNSIFIVLIESGAITTEIMSYYLLETINQDQVNIVKLMIDRGTVITTCEILSAVEHTGYDMVKLLIDHSIGLLAAELSAILLIAAKLDKVDIFRLLLQNGASLDFRSDTRKKFSQSIQNEIDIFNQRIVGPKRST